MTIKSDRWINEQAEAGMITPYAAQQVSSVDGQRIVSYGTSSYGYDVRCANEWMVFRPVYDLTPQEFKDYVMDESNTAEESLVIDPLKGNLTQFMQNIVADDVVIPPYGFVLCRTVEYFRIPRDVAVIVIGKSTYARCGIIVNCTPLEPEWTGQITIELSNTNPYPVRVHANQGIAQCLFYQSDEPCQISYADKKGKYQNQIGIVLPKV